MTAIAAPAARVPSAAFAGLSLSQIAVSLINVWPNLRRQFPSFDPLSPTAVDAVLYEHYVYLCSGDFAIAAHRMKGWTLVNLFDRFQGEPFGLHCMVRHPGGDLFDYAGRVDPPQLAARYMLGGEWWLEDATEETAFGQSVACLPNLETLPAKTVSICREKAVARATRIIELRGLLDLKKEALDEEKRVAG